jgi:hypothetical protein
MKKVIVAFILGMLVGAWIADQQKTVIKNDVKIEQIEDHVETKENKVVVEKIKPDGVIIRKIVYVKNTESTTKKDVAETKKEVIDRTKHWYAGVLAGTSFASATPVFGAQVSRHILGPVSIGAFALTNGNFGATLGMSF